MSNYDQLFKKAQSAQFKFKDYVDQPDHQQARRAMSEIDALVADIRNKKNGASIESRLKSIVRQLEDMEEEVMDFGHSRLIAKWYDDMRQEARSL